MFHIFEFWKYFEFFMPFCTRWHLVTVEIQKCDFLNNQERYEHTVLFCLKVLFQSIFNNKMNEFWEDHHLQFLIFQKIILRDFSAYFLRNFAFFACPQSHRETSTNKDACVMMKQKLLVHKMLIRSFQTHFLSWFLDKNLLSMRNLKLP